jgi:nitrogen regulatory protein P-II 1
MKKVEAVVRPEMVEKAKEIVDSMGAGGMTVTSVLGCGAQKGKKEMYRGAEMVINLLHKVKVEVVVADSLVDKLVDAFVKELQTGAVGDGKIFIIPVEDAIRIRTGEKGDGVL